MIYSIVTVNFNNKIGLENTIKSVISQDFLDYEFIVVDGGSSDGSFEIIKHYQMYFSWWCSEPDSGVYNAMNKGIMHANGDYIIFMNSGDFFYDEHVLTNVANLKLDADIISGQVVRIDNGKLIRDYNGKDLLMQLYKDTINHQGSFIKRTLFANSKYDESLKVVSDWKFWVEKIIYEGCRTKVVSLLIAKQDMTGLSTSSSSTFWHEERKKVTDELFPKMIQEELDDRYRNKAFWERINYLEKHNRTAYVIARKALAILVRMVSFFA